MSIPIPEAAPARSRRTLWHADEDEDFITIHEAETLAQSTGQYRGMSVEFSDDGVAWVDAWVPVGTATHPTHARATVKRRTPDGDLTSTTVVLRWEEFVPALDDENRPFWDEKPTVMLGKCAKVSAYRGGFHDVIGNRYERAEFHRKHAPLAITA